VVIVGKVAEALEEGGFGDAVAAGALHGFDDDADDFARIFLEELFHEARASAVRA